MREGREGRIEKMQDAYWCPSRLVVECRERIPSVPRPDGEDARIGRLRCGTASGWRCGMRGTDDIRSLRQYEANGYANHCTWPPAGAERMISVPYDNTKQTAMRTIAHGFPRFLADKPVYIQYMSYVNQFLNKRFAQFAQNT